MATYSEIPEVDAAFARWVKEEDAPPDLHPPALARDALRAALQALDPDVRVQPVVDATVELSHAVLAVKASRLVPALQYAELRVYVAGAARLALLEWEWKRAGEQEPSRAAALPDAPDRVRALEAKVRALLEAEGVQLVPQAEARREVRVADDPRYDGQYYEIQVFEALFGMGYPERQR
jgi:hypothetical protein